MITSEDVRRVTFDKAMRGYRCEDVDDYLKQVASSMDSFRAENEDLQKKLVVLAQRIDQYRAEEDTLHTTLINAQRLGENVIKEAKQKAAEVLRAANIRAEDSAQRARDEVELSKQELMTLKKEAGDFKKTLLDMYRKHVELISGIPEYNGAAPSAAPVSMAPAAMPEAEPAMAPEQAYAEPEAATPPYEAPAYEEENDPPADSAAGPLGEGKIDTVEFAIAPHEEAATPPAAEGYTNPFAPGAGLYDRSEEAETPPARSRTAAKKPAARRTKKQPTAQDDAGQLPEAFNSFSGIDFDS
ncbi:MAG: DivIVA domain-containing protein [Gemmiger sp.]|nr:DivIVA domain-containing protein [Gemmiger sp.]